MGRVNELFKNALEKLSKKAHATGHDLIVSSAKYARLVMMFGMLMIGAGFISVSFKHSLDALNEYSSDQRPLKSMVFVERTDSLKLITCIDGYKDRNICELNKYTILLFVDYLSSNVTQLVTGSAAVISHDMSRDSSYVITAYHVCTNMGNEYANIDISDPEPHTLMFIITSKITLTDYEGNRYRATKMRVDKENDICILQTDRLMENSPPVKVARTAPNPGDRIYNIASPRSLSHPGAVLSYEGYFAGLIAQNDAINSTHYLFAIPTAPGSSGSIILNDRGEIISIISYGFSKGSPGLGVNTDMWPMASAGPPLEKIQKLIAPRKIQ